MSITENFEKNKESWIDNISPTAYYMPIPVEQLLTHARALETRNRELVEMLRKHEWYTDEEFEETFCIECGNYKPGTSPVWPKENKPKDGHSPNCQLAKLIGGGGMSDFFDDETYEDGHLLVKQEFPWAIDKPIEECEKEIFDAWNEGFDLHGRFSYLLARLKKAEMERDDAKADLVSEWEHQAGESL